MRPRSCGGSRWRGRKMPLYAVAGQGWSCVRWRKAFFDDGRRERGRASGGGRRRLDRAWPSSSSFFLCFLSVPHLLLLSFFFFCFFWCSLFFPFLGAVLLLFFLTMIMNIKNWFWFDSMPLTFPKPLFKPQFFFAQIFTNFFELSPSLFSNLSIFPTPPFFSSFPHFFLNYLFLLFLLFIGWVFLIFKFCDLLCIPISNHKLPFVDFCRIFQLQVVLRRLLQG